MPATKCTRLLLLVALTFAIIGCGAPQTRDTDVRQATMPQFQSAPARNAVLLDVRSAEAYAKGHVPGAINVPLPNINLSLRQAIAPDREVIVYADDGKGLATAAAKKLIALGYANVSEFRGGYAAWRAANPDL